MKIITTVLVLLYLYTLAFGIFMTPIFRIPAPMIFCLPLLLFCKDDLPTGFRYGRTLLLLLVACLLYDVVGLSAINSFAAHGIAIFLCVCFFNYYVGNDSGRLRLTIYVFFAWLVCSSMVMVMDHFVDNTFVLRTLLMGEPIQQSPSGISIYQFTFGYQVAALTSFAFIHSCVYRQPFIIKSTVFLLCIVFLFLGMQRSAFIAFMAVVAVFMLFYYGSSALFSLSLVTIICIGIYNYVLKDNLGNMENIVTKNVHNDAAYNRSGLVEENLRIYLDYPYGLIFYGKSWGDVIYRDYVFASGITSHNAYLMFFTYLGPFLGLGLLIAIYFKVMTVIVYAIRFIRNPANAMLVALSFSFIGVSINALSHNPWLIAADGPTLFLYFAMIHQYRQQEQQILQPDAPFNKMAYV
ncbi:hypothetical protein PBAL39_01927 [Pedobacter sp. BAL39]|uniref:O-antigen ligase family protein n=1 Tax=Pedobacter sp. BAL39 TaxID=391596 RepID=UPI0001559B89|nr:O-antigen ligase family protein [Pedobacter sp. BAL39]EDM38334.1 hypothetical protein PBAL39_01927 [Pedobacter sp. BAL39]